VPITTAAGTSVETVEMFSFTTSERIFLSSLLAESTIFYEFGSGGSTELACSFLHRGSNSSRLTWMGTVDSDLHFLSNLLNSSACLSQAMREGFFHPHTVELGPTTIYGYPATYDNEHVWHHYPQSILPFLTWVEEEKEKEKQTNKERRKHSTDDSTDNSLLLNHHLERVEMEQILVLVDGRFRVASALYSLFAFIQLYGLQQVESQRRHLRVLIHDFFSRPHYYDVFEYFELVDCVGEMVLLQPKPPQLIAWHTFFEDLGYYVKETR
jgi:hypothetical protein